MDTNYPRRPYNCRPELEKWKNDPKSHGLSLVMKMRSFKFLKYPQVDQEAFDELYSLTQEWAKEKE